MILLFTMEITTKKYLVLPLTSLVVYMMSKVILKEQEAQVVDV